MYFASPLVRKRAHAATRHSIREYERRQAREKKFKILGPCLSSCLITRCVELWIPQPGWNKEIWTFWIQHGAKWNSEKHRFEYAVTGNQGAWLNRATERFNEQWKNI